MSEESTIENRPPHNETPEVRQQIADYERWISASGPHSKHGKFYRRQVAELKKFIPQWPEELKSFSNGYTIKSFPDAETAVIPPDKGRGCGGFSKDEQLALYDKEGRMVVTWGGGRRFENQYDEYGRIVASRLIDDSTKGKFDGDVRCVTRYTYEAGQPIKGLTSLQYPHYGHHTYESTFEKDFNTDPSFAKYKPESAE